MSRVIATFFALLFAAVGAAQEPLESTTYDAALERAAIRWMPEYDWRWLKSQCWQESRFNPRAISPAGAKGLCQFMPPAWGEAQRALGVRDVYSSRENAWAAGWHMRRQLAIWTDKRTDYERLELAQASYNAGAGHIIEAQRQCGGAPDWARISLCLPDVTGHHARETIGYVCQIRGWMGRIVCRPVPAGLRE